jgi:hypothetical protein
MPAARIAGSADCGGGPDSRHIWTVARPVSVPTASTSVTIVEAVAALGDALEPGSTGSSWPKPPPAAISEDL